MAVGCFYGPNHEGDIELAFDAGAPAEEVLSTLDALVRAGKVRYIGVSNFAGWQVMKSLAVAEAQGWPRYVAHQVYYSLVGRDYEWDLMPLGADRGLVFGTDEAAFDAGPAVMVRRHDDLRDGTARRVSKALLPDTALRGLGFGRGRDLARRTTPRVGGGYRAQSTSAGCSPTAHATG